LTKSKSEVNEVVFVCVNEVKMLFGRSTGKRFGASHGNPYPRLMMDMMMKIHATTLYYQHFQSWIKFTMFSIGVIHEHAENAEGRIKNISR